MTLFLVAGEASGDARGAELIAALSALRPGIRFAGLGGPRMRSLSDGEIEDWIERAAVIGIVDVLRHYPFFKRQMDRARRAIAGGKPDAVIPIDYPGFNLRLAAAAKADNPGVRVLYYISPQVWAWHTGRIAKMARYLDRMLCIFPFEPPLYERSGLASEFVGHPIVEALGPLRSSAPRDPDTIALLPGSRSREIDKIFPAMLGAAGILRRGRPALRFEAAAASEAAAVRMRALLSGHTGIPCEIRVGSAHELMVRAAAGMVASGTATLEAAFLGLPHLLVYRVSAITYEIAKRLIRVPHLGIVNILAGREVVPEFVQAAARPDALAAGVARLLDDPAALAAHREGVEGALRSLGGPGAAERAARAILATLDGPSPAPPR
jgi:lipid-A-disaccharide synthase